MSPSKFVRVSTLLSGFIACSPEAPPEPLADGAHRFVHLGDPTVVVGGAANDSLLLIPAALAVDGRQALLFDYGDFRLKSFDLSSGELNWAVGQSGRGPGEFANPIQVALSPVDSTTWVLDGGASRIARIAGREHIGYATLPSGSERVERVARLVDRVVATVFSTTDRFAAELTATGSLEGNIPYPVDGFAGASPYQRQSEVAVAEDGHRWVAAYLFTSSFAVFDGLAAQCTGSTRTARSIADLGEELNPKARSGATAISGSTVVVLTRDDERDRLDVLEFFDANSCEYAYSIRLPGPARGVALRSSKLVVLFVDSVPALHVYDIAGIEGGI